MPDAVGSGEPEVPANVRAAEPIHWVLGRLGLRFQRPGAAPGGRWLPYRAPNPPLPPAIAVQAGPRGHGPVTVPLERITTSPGFSYASDGWHPYVATIEEYEADSGLRYEDSSLCATFVRFVPATAQAALLEDVEGPLHPLHLLPPRVAGYEWTITRAEVRRALRGNPPRWLRAGKRTFGPVAPAEGRRRFGTLLEVHRSLREHGLRPERATDPVRGHFLVSGDDYRFVLTGGQHRVASLRVLGARAIGVELDWLRAVHRDRLERWTEPRGGPYPAEVAGLLFERGFAETGRRKARNLGLVP